MPKLWHCICFADGIEESQWDWARMGDFVFEPIRVNERAPGGERILRSFYDIGAFILTSVDVTVRQSQWWRALRKELPQVRFGARHAEAYEAVRRALMEEGWLSE
jgi:hypothetical protein